MSFALVCGTKVVRKAFDLSGGVVFYGLQDKSVQSIMGADEKRREMTVGFCIDNAGKKCRRILSAYAMRVRFRCGFTGNERQVVPCQSSASRVWLKTANNVPVQR